MHRASVVAFLACWSLIAQDSRTLILAAGRSGAVEFIDPSTLETVGRIHFNLDSPSAGLNGVSASADGRLLYVDGPLQNEAKGCCTLYSVDLATLQAQPMVPNPRSRYPAEMRNDRLHFSPDGRWLFGVRSFRGPVLDVYDLTGGKLVRQLSPSGLAGDYRPTGIWSGDQFYLYAANDHGDGRLWAVSPDTPKLGPGITVAPLGPVPGCSDQGSNSLAASGGKLFLYEQFGFKVDRRIGCAGQIPGGAWIVDGATGQLVTRISQDLHFSVLFAEPNGSDLYGLAVEGTNWESPRLVRIDPVDGHIILSRTLDSGFWRVAIAPVRMAPSGEAIFTNQKARSVP
jgi:hypothetical protein